MYKKINFFEKKYEIGGGEEEDSYISLDQNNIKTIYNMIIGNYGYKFNHMSFKEFKHHVEAYGLYGMDVETIVYELENSRFAAEVVKKMRRPRKALAHTL